MAKTKIIKNPNKEKYDEVTRAVILNSGYCPCMVQKNDDTKCMCKDFRLGNKLGECHCGRFIRITVDNEIDYEIKVDNQRYVE